MPFALKVTTIKTLLNEKVNACLENIKTHLIIIIKIKQESQKENLELYSTINYRSYSKKS